MKPLRVLAGSVATIVLLVSSGHAERVGPTDTWVDITRPLPYRIEGGSKEFQAAGEICSLMKTFVVEGDGVTVKFTPKSNRRGRYYDSRKVDGVEVLGRGTYEVQYDGRLAIGIVATDSGSGEETGTYRLKHVPGACME
jgi:hypothetical protein